MAKADAIYAAELQQPGVHAMEVFGIGPQRQAGGGWQPDSSLPGAAARSQGATLAAAPDGSGPADLASLPVTSFSAEPARDAGASGGAGAISVQNPDQDPSTGAGGDAPAAYAAALAAERQAPYKPNTGFGLEQKPNQARPLGDWEARLQAAVAARAASPAAASQPQTLQGLSSSAAQPPAAAKRSALGDRRLLAAAGGDAGAPAAKQAQDENRDVAARGGAGEIERANTVRVTIRAHTRQGAPSHGGARAPAGGPAVNPTAVRAPTSGLRGARAGVAAPGSLERTGAAEALRAESPDMGLALPEQARRRAAQVGPPRGHQKSTWLATLGVGAFHCGKAALAAKVNDRLPPACCASLKANTFPGHWLGCRLGCSSAAGTFAQVPASAQRFSARPSYLAISRFPAECSLRYMCRACRGGSRLSRRHSAQVSRSSVCLRGRAACAPQRA